MKDKKLLLIVNPKSGTGKMKGHLMSVTEIFSDAGYEITVYPTKCPGDGTVRAAKVKQNEYDLIVVSGGDGTLNEVVTGLMQSKTKCTLGYIPSGTLNEWSTSLGIAKNIKKAAKDIAEGKPVPLDIGKFSNRYFTYTASFGAFTSASYSVPQDIKNVFGQTAYFFEGIKSLTAIKPIHLGFKCKEREFEGDFLFGAISNSLSVGGIVKYNKKVVELNDGLFEVFLIRNPNNILKFQPLIDGILRHDFNKEGMEFFHTDSITITGGNDISWTLDGEFAPGKDEITIENIHGGINLIIPDKKGKLLIDKV